MHKFFYFIKGGADNVPGVKKENMFLQMLEGLYKDEAEVVCLVKDKQLQKKYRITHAVVKEAFRRSTGVVGPHRRSEIY